MKVFQHITGWVCIVLCALGFDSCLDSNESETVATNVYNTIVTSFSMETNVNVCDGLNKYHFTIDNYGLSDDSIHRLFPNDGIIFNPDSLPAGSIPDSIKVSMTVSSPYSVLFNLYGTDGKLGQHSNFSSDSALFFGSYPDCRLTLTALGGNTKTYHIKINVHKVVSDTISWHNYTTELWSDRNIEDQRVDTLGNKLFWFIQEGNHNYASTSLFGDSKCEWQPLADVTTPEGELLDLTTLYNWHDALYAVGQNSQKLLTTIDGYNWEIANDELTFTSILGNQLKTSDVYGNWNSDSLNAIVKVGNEYRYAVSADAHQWNVENIIKPNFPIKGFSRPICIAARNKYGNLTSRLYIVGGVTANGDLVSSTWSCDGWLDADKGPNWEDFEQNELPAMQGASVIQYTLDKDHPGSLWLLQPGLKADGSIPTNRLYGRDYTTLYFSEDNGVSWHRLSRYYTQYADNSSLDAVSCSSAFHNPADFRMYFFGGRRQDGTFKTAVWGGTLNSLTFEKIR